MDEVRVRHDVGHDEHQTYRQQEPWDQMREYVHGLIVEEEEGVPAVVDVVGLSDVPVGDVVVVLLPRRQLVVAAEIAVRRVACQFRLSSHVRPCSGPRLGDCLAIARLCGREMQLSKPCHVVQMAFERWRRLHSHSGHVDENPEGRKETTGGTSQENLVLAD